MGAQASVELLTSTDGGTVLDTLSVPLLEQLLEHVHEGLRTGLREACQQDESLALSESAITAALIAYTLRPARIELSDLAGIAERGAEDASITGRTLYILGNSFIRARSPSSFRLSPLQHQQSRSLSPPSGKRVPARSVDFDKGLTLKGLAGVTGIAMKAREAAAVRRPSRQAGGARAGSAAAKRASAGAAAAMKSGKSLKDAALLGVGPDGATQVRQGRQGSGADGKSPGLKAAALLGDKVLEQRALDSVGEHAQINKKVLDLVGDATKLAPPAARKRLGSEMALDVKMHQVEADKAELRRESEKAERDRMQQLEAVIHAAAPDAEAGIAPTGIDHKAAAMLGESLLEQKAMEAVGHNAQVNSKVMDLVGDANKLAPQRARKRLGSIMSPGSKAQQIIADMDEKQHEADEAERERQRQLRAVISMESPPRSAGIAAMGVDHKAAALLGDKSLEQRALESVSVNAQINSKVMEMVGDANKLAPAPARKRLGSVMSSEKKAEQVRADIEAKQRAEDEAERERQRHLQTVISMDAPEVDAGIASTGVDRKAAALLGDKSLEQRALEAVGHNAQVNKKVMEMVGDANKLAPQPARKRLGSVMSAEMKAEQVRADLEAQRRREEAAETERQQAVDGVLNKAVKESMLKTKGGLTNKAAAVMGDQALHRRAMERVSADAQVNKKVLDLLGSAAVASNKARDMLGEEDDDAPSQRSRRARPKISFPRASNGPALPRVSSGHAVPRSSTNM